MILHKSAVSGSNPKSPCQLSFLFTPVIVFTIGAWLPGSFQYHEFVSLATGTYLPALPVDENNIGKHL